MSAHSSEAKRYIMSFECPGTFELGGRRWARLVVVGQSFMLHQIRKMVGMAAAVMRGAAPEACLRAALDPDRDFNVPMAPELGLFLVGVLFQKGGGGRGGARAAIRMCAFLRHACATAVLALVRTSSPASHLLTVLNASTRNRHHHQPPTTTKPGRGVL